MRFAVRNQPACKPDLSIVLLDWGCRESFHLLDDLSEQTADRRRYEILWVEYYDKPSQRLCERIEADRSAGRPPCVDTYALLEMDRGLCYHKHLMMNAGIVLARGRIVCFVDSDAMVRPTFVESVITTFEGDWQIVLHLDEVRNNDASFYPFRRPALQDVTGFGCVNWLNGRPTGLLDKADPTHTRNYGACMAATRDDLVAVGGADMHTDYLGHIAGAYEMTWRLVNAGRREVWHDGEWLYHVWHPGQAGEENVAGPHDGMHISTRALLCRSGGRIEPFVANRAIALLRDSGTEVDEGRLRDALIDPAWREQWRYQRLRTTVRTGEVGGRTIRLHEHGENNAPPAGRPTAPRPLFGYNLPQWARPLCVPTALRLLRRQFAAKLRAARLSRPPARGRTHREWLRKLAALVRFARRIVEFDRYLFRQCWRGLAYAAQEGNSRLVLYGEGDSARILCTLSRFLPVTITAICPFRPDGRRRLLGRPRISEDQLATAGQTIVVAAFVNTEAHLTRLEQLGIGRHSIITLQ